MLPSIFAGLILIPSWAYSAHFILTFSWDFNKSFGLPRPNYHIFYFRGLLAFAPTPFINSFLWTPPTHFCLLSISYSSHRLTTFFFGLPWAHLFSLGPFLLFYRPVDYYSCYLGLMVFSCFASSSFFIPCYIVRFFLAIGPFLFCRNGPQQDQDIVKLFIYLL